MDDEDIVIVDKEVDAEANVERRKSKRRSVSRPKILHVNIVG